MIIPYIVGRMLAPRETNGPVAVALWGYVAMWALFEGAAAAALGLGWTLEGLARLYLALVAVAAVASLIFFRDLMADDLREWGAGLQSDGFRRAFLSAMAAIVLVLAQAAFVAAFMHSDADDAEYIAMANDAWERGGLLETDPYTGFKWTDASTKRFLSPFSLWIAVVSKINHVQPARYAHFWLPALVVVLGHAAVFVALEGVLKKRFRDEPAAPWFGLLIFSVMVIFGGATTRSYGSMALLRGWQGKAVLCGVALPLFFSELMALGGEEGGAPELIHRLIRLLALSAASLLLTGMSVPMVPLIFGAFGVTYGCEWILRKLH